LSGLLAFFALGVSVLALGSMTALFLGARSRADLPYAYAGTALFGVACSALVAFMSERASRMAEALLVFSAEASVLLLSWLFLRLLDSRVLFLAYPMCTSMSALAMVQAFAIVSDCVDADQAKRLLPLVGASGTLGAVFAGGAMAVLAPAIGVHSLLLLAALLVGVLAAVALRLAKDHMHERTASLRPAKGISLRPSKNAAKRRASMSRGMGAALSLLVEEPLVRLFALLTVASMVASTLLRYEFETALQRHLTVEHITVFLGLFNLAANGTVFLVQTLIERRLLKRFGLFFGLLSVPTVFSLLLPLLLFIPGIASVALIRFAEHTARFSIARTADDLVLLPISSMKRRRARTLVSGALVPLSIFSASLLIVALGDGLGRARVTLAWLCGALAVLVATAMRKPYLERLRGSLARARVSQAWAALASPPKPEHGLNEAIELALGSSDPKRLLFGLGMAAETRAQVGEERLLPLYHHVDGRVREAAFLTALRVGTPDFAPALLSAFADERDAHARLACARALCAHAPESQLDDLSPLLADDSPAIRAEALARRYAARRDDAESLTKLSQGSDSDRAGVAYALSRIEVPTQGVLLGGLLRDSSLEVRRAALRAATRVHEPQHLPHVVAALDHRSLGKQAVDVLRAWPATTSIPALATAASPSAARRTRLLALSGLARIAHGDAVQTLLGFVNDPSLDVRRAALRSLLRQRTRGADLSRGRVVAMEAALSELKLAQWAAVASSALTRANLAQARRTRAARELEFAAQKAEENLFSWLALVYPRDEMLRTQRSVFGRDRQARAFAFEMLEQTLDANLRRELLPWLRAVPAERAYMGERALGLRQNPTLLQVFEKSPGVPGPQLARYLGVPIGESAEDIAMSTIETMFALRGVELFSQLSSEELRAVAELSDTARYAKDAVIFREQEPGDALFILLRGEVEVSHRGKSVAVLSDGECFGELALLDRGVRSATITARTDCELARIRAEDFHDLLDEAPSIARAMLLILARRQASLLDKG
jgi:HEAT repeat protein